MRTRARAVPVHPAAAAVAAAALAAAGLAAVATPARAVTFEANDANSFATALLTAADNGSADIISLTGDIAIPGTGPSFTTDEDLTIEGNGFTLTTTLGPGDVTQAFDPTFSDGAVFTLRDVTITGFNGFGAGAVRIQSAFGEVILSGVTVSDNIGGGIRVVSDGSDVTVTDSTFIGNSGATGPGGSGLAVLEEDDSYFETTITGSTFESNSTDKWGGAVYTASDLLTIEDSTFTSNHADWGGGAVYAAHDLAVSDSTFASNTATDDGGAIFGDEGSITDSTFTWNSVADRGGAVFVDWDLDITGSTFSDSSSGTYGGAVFSWGHIGVEDSTFERNSTGLLAEGGGDGGALYSGEDAVDVYDSTFDSNSAEGSGGAVYAEYGEMSIIDSSFTGNTAGENGGAFHGDSMYSASTTYAGNHTDGQGGAIYAEGYSDIYDSTLSGNTSGGHGSAVYVLGDDYSYIESSTFTGNRATAGVGTFVQERGFLDVYFSTFADNWTAGNPVHLWASGYGEGFEDDGVIYSLGSIYTGAMGSSSACAADGFETSYNLDDDGTCTGGWSGEGDIAGDAMLGDLADNGGSTLTREPRQASAAIDLIPADVCLAYFGDGGEPELPVEGPGQNLEILDEEPEETDSSLDQRGLSRFEALEYQNGGCDAGSIEVVKDITFPVETPVGEVTVTASGAWTQECVDNLTIAEAGGLAPAGVAFPYGALAYCFILPWDGGSVDVTLTLPTPVNQFWKTGETWAEVAGATISADGMTVAYSVTDGGTLDEDGAINAYIVDPAAPGVGAVFTG